MHPLLVTSVLQDKQYTFGVKSLLMDGHKSVVDEDEPGRRVVSTIDAMIAAIDTLMRFDRRVMGWDTRSPASAGIANRPLVAYFWEFFLIFGSNTPTWSVENQLHY